MAKIKKSKLNVDIPEAINELEAMMKAFRLKKEIYRILFRGKGLEFEGFRKFTPDDDAADIDWKTSARAEKLLVKQYKEERDLRIMFIIDVGSNMVFGSTDKLKCEFVTELVAALSHLIVSSNDKIGFFFFSDAISNFVDCKTGLKHFHYFVDLLSNPVNYGGQTNLNQAIDFAMEYFSKSISSIFIVSDFLSVTPETEKRLTLLSSMFETVLVQVRDPLDISLPDVEGEVVLEDPATNEQVVVNPKVAKVEYEKYVEEQQDLVAQIFNKTQADYLGLTTDKPFAEPLVLFLQERRHTI